MNIRKAKTTDLDHLMELFEVAKQYMVASDSGIPFQRTDRRTDCTGLVLCL